MKATTLPHVSLPHEKNPVRSFRGCLNNLDSFLISSGWFPVFGIINASLSSLFVRYVVISMLFFAELLREAIYIYYTRSL
jgi:hypothetical protein